MIQRKQTLFLLLAVVAIVVCLFLPIAGMEPNAAMGSDSLLYNLGVVGGDKGGITFSSTCLPLFLLLAVSACLSIVNIFMYKNRNLQKSLCSVVLLFGVLWYIDYALMLFGVVLPVTDTAAQGLEASGKMSLKFAACLPLVSMLLVWMAKKGVNDDIQLLKAADRIR